jgi:hypothetical protein
MSSDLWRFWSKVAMGDINDCWLWTSNVNTSGYGTFSMQRKGIRQRMFYAHRLAYFFTLGDIPKGIDVCHSCDNRLCVNPAHLFLGDRKANVQDCVTKCRHSHGERHTSAKLTEADAIAILSDRRTQEVIAELYGIHQMTVSDLKRGKTWKHLPR